MNLPNKLTLLRVVMIPLFLLFFLVDTFPLHYLWALLVFILASLTDMLDGKIARSRGLVTDFGKLMDPLADKLLVMSALICLLHDGRVFVLSVIIILAREFIVTSIRLVAAGSGTVIAADVWGKIKTVLQIIWICWALLRPTVAQILMNVLGIYAGTAGDAEINQYMLVINTFNVVHYLLGAAVLFFTVASGFNYVWKNRQLFADA